MIVALRRVRRSDALLTQNPPYNCAAKYQGLNPEVQEVGDTLNFNDQLTTNGISYRLNPTTLLRDNGAQVVISISYDKIEEIASTILCEQSGYSSRGLSDWPFSGSGSKIELRPWRTRPL